VAKQIIQTVRATDGAGQAHTLYVLARVIQTPDGSSGPSSTLSQVWELQTSDGRGVHWIAKGRYQTIDGVTLLSSDPHAP
jgi:hypothetical protein